MRRPPCCWTHADFGSDDQATFVLRSRERRDRLVHCWLALLCLRLLFPENLAAQAVGLLVAAFLPPHLYLSQYVTNEPLAGLFVTVAFYLCLRALRAEKETLYLHLGIGVALGAAMLTKLSALLACRSFLSRWDCDCSCAKIIAARLAAQHGRGHVALPGRLRLALRTGLGALWQTAPAQLGNRLATSPGGRIPGFRTSHSTSLLGRP